MSADAAKAVVRRFYTELFRDLASAEECISPDYVDHNNADAGHGPNALRSHVASLLHTFPDFTIEIEDLLAEGDRVVTRVTGRGTHSEHGCRSSRLAPSSKEAAIAVQHREAASGL